MPFLFNIIVYRLLPKIGMEKTGTVEVLLKLLADHHENSIGWMSDLDDTNRKAAFLLLAVMRALG